MARFESFISQRSGSHLRLIAAIMMAAVIIMFGYGLRRTITSFLLSFVIAYLIDPLVFNLESRRIPRIQAIIFLYFVFGIITIFCITILVPLISINWHNLLQNLPEYLQKIKLQIADWQTHLPAQYESEEIIWLTEKLAGSLNNILEALSAWFYDFIGGMVFNIFNIILSPILVFFMLYYKSQVLNTVEARIPLSKKPLIMTICHEINESIGGYLRGQVLVSVIVALAIIPALYFLDTPSPVLCGLFAGTASVLPFIGVVIALLPAMLLTWLKFGAGAMLFKVLLVFTFVYFVEGYLIKPLVFKKSMNLNPLLSIIMVMAFGELLGFWGVLLALPLTAAIKIAWQHWISGDFDGLENEP